MGPLLAGRDPTSQGRIGPTHFRNSAYLPTPFHATGQLAREGGERKLAKFEIRDAVNGQYYWRFVADNGQVLCTSETYTTKQNARNSVSVVKQTAADAQILDLTRSALTDLYRR